MRRFGLFIFLAFLGLFQPCQGSGGTAATPPKPKPLREIISIKTLTPPRQRLQLTSLARPRKSHPGKPAPTQQERLIQRRDVPFQHTFIGVPVQIENVHPNQPGAAGGGLPKAPQVPRPPIKPNETEAERAERIHKSFERLLTFVEIVGQVDNYVSSKWKNLVKTVSNFYEAEDEPYRVNAKRFVGSCPHAH